MSSLRHLVRLFFAQQLLPVLESGEETLVGGQAVMEGVMMRSPHAWGIAVRKPDGSTVVHSEGLDRPSEKRKWLGWPFIRGIATLGQAMVLGFRALQFSANVALEEEQKEAPTEKRLQLSGWVLGMNVALSAGFFIVMYKLLPWYATTRLRQSHPGMDNWGAMALVDGGIRIALFLTFIWLTSRMKDIARIFEYHGAEHKTVFAFESGKDVTIEHAQSYPTFHPRCGTSFLMTVMLIAILVYMPFSKLGLWSGFAARVLLLPVIIGVSYEIIRFAAKRRASFFALLTQPGLWLQRITTQPPDDVQVQCAIRALDEAMRLEKERGGELVLA